MVARSRFALSSAVTSILAGSGAGATASTPAPRPPGTDTTLVATPISPGPPLLWGARLLSAIERTSLVNLPKSYGVEAVTSRAPRVAAWPVFTKVRVGFSALRGKRPDRPHIAGVKFNPSLSESDSLGLLLDTFETCSCEVHATPSLSHSQEVFSRRIMTL